MFLATVIHKPADALTIVSLMLRAGVPRLHAHLVNLGFALMIPAGVTLFLLGIREMGHSTSVVCTANALAFSAGTFLCIALSDLLPELQFHAHDRFKLSLALLAGFALMALTSVVEHEEGPGPGPRDRPLPLRKTTLQRTSAIPSFVIFSSIPPERLSPCRYFR